MLSSPFFRRLFLPYLLLICLATVIVGMAAASRLRASHIEQTSQALRRDTELVARLIEPDLSAGRTAHLAHRIREVGVATEQRITVVSADGTVIADNEADAAQMDNHRLRPEIMAAAAGGEGASVRESGTVHDEMLYFARRVDPGEAGGPPPYYVRLAVHLRDLDRHLRSLYAALAAAALAAVLAAGALCFHFARRSSAPVLQLTAFAHALAGGDLSPRVGRGTVRSDGEIGTLAAALNTMADSLGRLVGQATKDKAELLAILSGMTDGVVAIDGEQKILLVNAAAGTLLGFATEGVQGRRLWEVVRSEPIVGRVAEAMSDSRRAKFPVGPVLGRHLELTACPLRADGAEGLVLVIHDSTESVRYQDLRTEFVANVSHELRTPLTAIKGFAETLRDGALHDPVRGPQYLATIEKHADQLTNLVADLLDLSRLDDDPGLPGRVPMDIAPVARRAVDLLQPAAARKRQSVHVDLPRRLPRIEGNPEYLERAITNLLENAIKYTPDGGHIRLSVAADDGTQIRVAVSDDGLGIPPADLPRIFERFYRVDRSRSREMGGTGLGLSIVKHVAQAHGGSVDVSSTPGQGSTFTLTLPISPPSASA